MDRFIFDIIFNIEKDKPLISAKQFKGRVYKKYKIEINNDLFVAINNYQIKKYGIPLGNPKKTGINHQDLVKGIMLMKCQKRYRLRRED